MQKDNKKILVNTVIMYGRLIITTILGLLISRYVLLALGASDFGLYSVVAGLISMLNVLSTAMSTTTRRYINVEMGKTDGNLNQIFNISRLLHFGFAAFIFLIAETIGMFYIYNYLNVETGKLSDAIFVFQVSTIAAAISIINIPYQSLLEANERFTQVAILDILRNLLKFIFILCLAFCNGNVLRVYAVGMSAITLITLLFYSIACFIQWKEVVKYKFYKGTSQYKEILYFNNYVALGATAYLSRTQASAMLVNYFFGTIVNAAFAIGYAIENYCMMFVSNIGSAAAPQITRNYANNLQRSFQLTAVLNKLSVYLMFLVVVPLSLEMDFVLQLWLKEVPDGAHIVCQLTLASALIRVVFGGKDKLVQASGKIKWFQITGCILDLSSIPISFVLFKLGFAAHTVITVYIIVTAIHGVWTFYLMKRLLNFDVWAYVKIVYPRVGLVTLGLTIFMLTYIQFHVTTTIAHVAGLGLAILTCLICLFVLGLNSNERKRVVEFIRKKL